VLPSAPSTCILFPLAIEVDKFVPSTVKVCEPTAEPVMVVGETFVIVGGSKLIVAVLVASRPAPFVTTTLKGLFAACPDAKVPILNPIEPEFVNTKPVTS
jgi:hypothetical protein